MGKAIKKIMAVVGLAALAGYVAGLLTAPKSGQETREDIKSVAQNGLNEAEKQLKRASTELGSLIEDSKKRANDLGEKARRELEGLVSKARIAREKAREVLTAIHDGNAEDKDLNEAIDETNNAIEHLRAYLKK